MKYWLLKTEPNAFSWSDLRNETDLSTSWEGVRNYQARNYIRDDMKKGDLAFIYHSVVKPMAIMGISKVIKEAYPDHFAFDPGHKYFDPKSKPENPAWMMVDIRAYKEFESPVTLDELKTIPGLEDMVLLQKGSRLSVQPVSEKEWNIIISIRKLLDL